MVGPPGAGKGTQAQILAARLGLPHVASGDLFRSAVKDDTVLGQEVQRYLDRGVLVPDDVAVRVIEDRLARPDATGGAILDGFPRTRPQAATLDGKLRGRGAEVAAALYIGIGQQELLRRLAGRWVCREHEHVYHEVFSPPQVAGVCDLDGSELYQRPDDTVRTIATRLERQLAPMYEVVDYYTEAGVLHRVNGEASIQEVTDSLLRAIAQPAR